MLDWADRSGGSGNQVPRASNALITFGGVQRIWLRSRRTLAISWTGRTSNRINQVSCAVIADGDRRFDGRSDRRFDGRFDRRSDRRSDGRSDRRFDGRSNRRFDGRSDRRFDRGTNWRLDRGSNWSTFALNFHLGANVFVRKRHTGRRSTIGLRFKCNTSARWTEVGAPTSVCVSRQEVRRFPGFKLPRSLVCGETAGPINVS